MRTRELSAAEREPGYWTGEPMERVSIPSAAGPYSFTLYEL